MDEMCLAPRAPHSAIIFVKVHKEYELEALKLFRVLNQENRKQFEQSTKHNLGVKALWSLVLARKLEESSGQYCPLFHLSKNADSRNNS
jgi:hypothetical protein